jgi:hypothetical protein
MLQKLLIADAGMLVLGIFVTRLIFRAAIEKTSLAPSK